MTAYADAVCACTTTGCVDVLQVGVLHALGCTTYDASRDEPAYSQQEARVVRCTFAATE